MIPTGWRYFKAELHPKHMYFSPNIYIMTRAHLWSDSRSQIYEVPMDVIVMGVNIE